MERLELAGTSRTTSQLGYGCSSLMGALGRKESLTLLEAAYDAGIRHYDVAPMYGFGAAEACLGEFLGRHRNDVTVTTKYGIIPAKNQSLLAVARKLAGPVVKRIPALKSRLSRAAASVTAPAERASFTADKARESLERSLASLRTDRIDVWLLHDVEASELTDEGLLRFLEDSVAQGKLGAFGVGTDREKLPALLEEQPAYCGVLQYEWSVLDQPVGNTSAFRMHHRSLTDKFRQLHAAMTADSGTCKAWSDAVGDDLTDRETLAKLMLKAARVENPSSIILFSSKNAGHIQNNVRVAGDATLVEPARQLYALVQREGVPGQRGSA